MRDRWEVKTDRPKARGPMSGRLSKGGGERHVRPYLQKMGKRKKQVINGEGRPKQPPTGIRRGKENGDRQRTSKLQEERLDRPPQCKKEDLKDKGLPRVGGWWAGWGEGGRGWTKHLHGLTQK